MNAERLLTHYEKIADAPDAIGQLRRFILDLAVRGKLVAQDPNDEPASELLKRISKDKALLVNAGRTKGAKPVGLPKGAAVAVPAGWQVVPLGEIINSHLGGGTPSKNNHTYWAGNIRWASVKDVGKAKYLDETIDRITEEGLENSSSNLIPEGNLIVVTRMGLGQLSINRVPVAINQDLRALFLSSFVDIDYVYNFFLTYGLEGKGLTVKGIKIEELLAIPFPLPPLAEQHRIVAKIEELMGFCDRLEAARAEREATRDRLAASSLARLNAPSPETFQDDARFVLNALPALTTRPDQIKQLRQTILNLAVRGKLVQQDPNDEPAAELLKRIANEKTRLAKAGEIKCDEPPIGIKQGEFPFSPPNGWILTRLATISRRIHYGFTASANPSLKDVRMLRITDIQDNAVDWKTVPGCVIDPKSIDQYRVAKGDILIARTGGTIGKTFLVREVAVTAVFASYLIRVQGTSNVLDQFLKLFFESSLYWAQLYDGARGTGQPNVNGQTLGKLILPLPPLAEQHRIVAKVDELMGLCDRLEASLTDTAATRRRLLDALLVEALEPAEVREVEAVV